MLTKYHFGSKKTLSCTNMRMVQKTVLLNEFLEFLVLLTLFFIQPQFVNTSVIAHVATRMFIVSATPNVDFEQSKEIGSGLSRKLPCKLALPNRAAKLLNF